MRDFIRRNFTEAVELYQQSQPKDWSFIPCEEHSSERCGGWIMKDEANMYIGFVGNRGDVTFAGWEVTTPDTKFDERGRRIK